jgi:hypothetical protein
MTGKRKILAISLFILSFGLTVPAQTIENASRSTIGYVNSNGSVENSSRSTIGYAKGVNPKHAALFFFFFFKPDN